LNSYRRLHESTITDVADKRLAPWFEHLVKLTASLTLHTPQLTLRNLMFAIDDPVQLARVTADSQAGWEKIAESTLQKHIKALIALRTAVVVK
jgi:hypothetical protein